MWLIYVKLYTVSTYIIILFIPSIIHTGFKYQRPPPLPANHVNRQSLLDEIATILLKATIDPNKYETTLNITGSGGFGKTTTVISLCYYPVVKEHFTDGFVFIKLGREAKDPSIILSQLYHLLTGENLKHCDINLAEQEIKQLTSDYYRNILVIIDDVWHSEDAEPFVKAFSNCKTILTTRMNDLVQYIPSKQQSFIIGPMTQEEAISLLTSTDIDRSKLSQQDESLLEELVQNVHLWPLLLSLIRGQLSHYLKQYRLSYHEAIRNVQTKLCHKGLTAFDKNVIEKVERSREFAVKVCIEISLELLTKSLSDKIKSLILYTGIGTSLQKAVLNGLWSISDDQEVENIIDTLWAYGLIQFTHEIISSNNNTLLSVEVHAVISHYIMECIDSSEVMSLSPVGNQKILESVTTKLALPFQQSAALSLPIIDHLKNKLNEIEYGLLPHLLKSFSAYIVLDPHTIIYELQVMEYVLKTTSPQTINVLSLFDKEINSISSECKQMLNNAYTLCRKLNQKVQRNLYEKKYNILIQTVKEFIKSYPVYGITQKAITMVEKITSHCEGQLLDYMVRAQNSLKTATSDYHDFVTYTLPHIEFYVKVHKQISTSLLKGSPSTDEMFHYFESGKFSEELRSLSTNQLIKLQALST